MFGAHIALTAMFRTNDLEESESGVPRIAALIAATVAAVLLVIAARAWLYELLVYPHDPLRADMLIVIQEGIRRMLRGQNPYTMYHVPWDATLPYGPVLWLPYAVPLHDARRCALCRAARRVVRPRRMCPHCDGVRVEGTIWGGDRVAGAARGSRSESATCGSFHRLPTRRRTGRGLRCWRGWWHASGGWRRRRRAGY